jgi:hypothetical protein
MAWSELFAMALANSLVIFGINKATAFEFCHPDDNGSDFCDGDGVDKDSKMVLYRFRLWSIQSLGNFWSKPLFTCPPCMASVHSTYFYWGLMPATQESLILYPLYVLGLSGLVALINSVTKYGNS